MGEKIFYVIVSFEDRPDSAFTMKALSATDAAEKLRAWYSAPHTPRYKTFKIQDYPFKRSPKGGYARR